MKYGKLFVVIFILLNSYIYSQSDKETTIDKVIAVVGDNIVLQSDLEIQLQQLIQNGYKKTPISTCEVLEELLYQKLLLTQAGKDSVEVGESQVEAELDRRIRYFINQIGSEKALEEYYQKSIIEIKAEFYENIKEQMLVQTMQSNITNGIKVSPAEIKIYFNEIPKDSIPLINSEIEIAQIVINPPINPEEKLRIKNKLEEIRQEIINGADFGTKAYLYSEDPLSAKNNGELGLLPRGSLVPEFEAVAFNLKKGEVSEIIETKFGFHIMQLIDRKGEQINVRHILLIPKVSSQDLKKAKEKLDSIAILIKTLDTLTFEIAANLFSDDKESKNNNGKLINTVTGTTKFEIDQLDPQLFFMIDKMSINEISVPVIFQLPDGKKAYRLLKLITRTEPHRANLKDDYQRIQEVALAKKQNTAMQLWITKKLEKTYIRIDEQFNSCKLKNNWLKASIN